MPFSNFQLVRLFDPDCWCKFTYWMTNSAVLEANWSWFTLFEKAVYIRIQQGKGCSKKCGLNGKQCRPWSNHSQRQHFDLGLHCLLWYIGPNRINMVWLADCKKQSLMTLLEWAGWCGSLLFQYENMLIFQSWPHFKGNSQHYFVGRELLGFETVLSLPCLNLLL